MHSSLADHMADTSRVWKYDTKVQGEDHMADTSRGYIMTQHNNWMMMRPTANSAHTASSFFRVISPSLVRSPSGLLRTENAVRASSYGSWLLISPVISALNSSRVTFPSQIRVSITSTASVCFLLRWIPESLVWKPSAVIANWSSCWSMQPPPSVSKSWNISRIWSACAFDISVCL